MFKFMNNSDDKNSWHLICSCHSYEHQLHFDWDDADKELVVSVHLMRLPFWQRVKHAIKYVFGYGSKSGDFEETIVGRTYVSAKAFTDMGRLLDPNN